MSDAPPTMLDTSRIHRGRHFRLPSIPALAVVVAGLLIPSAPASAHPAAPGEPLSIEALNHSYSVVIPQLREVRNGPLVLRPSIPEGILNLQSHRVDLVLVGPGTFDATVEVTLSGNGILESELSLIGQPTYLRDAVRLPSQTLILPMRVRLGWDESDLVVDLLEVPGAIEVRVESGIGVRLVGSCLTMASIVPIGCETLEDSLTRIQVSLTDATGSYRIPASWIDDSTRQQLKETIPP